jgi:hypothetical protein
LKLREIPELPLAHLDLGHFVIGTQLRSRDNRLCSVSWNINFGSAFLIMQLLPRRTPVRSQVL